MTHWASPIGKKVLHQLSDLYRALVWEGFILLAVAAGEDNSAKMLQAPTSPPPHPTPLIQVEVAPTPLDMDLDKGGEGEKEGARAAAVEERGVGEESAVAATEAVVESEAVTESVAEGVAAGKSDAVAEVRLMGFLPSSDPEQHPSILVESLKQLTPLLTITSRVGRSLAELMSLLIRLSTSPLHRAHRRGAGHPLIMHSYQEPAREAIDVCMEVTNLLVESLRWEVPMPQACSSAMQSPIRDWLFAG